MEEYVSSFLFYTLFSYINEIINDSLIKSRQRTQHLNKNIICQNFDNISQLFDRVTCGDDVVPKAKKKYFNKIKRLWKRIKWASYKVIHTKTLWCWESFIKMWRHCHSGCHWRQQPAAPQWWWCWGWWQWRRWRRWQPQTAALGGGTVTHVRCHVGTFSKKSRKTTTRPTADMDLNKKWAL